MEQIKEIGGINIMQVKTDKKQNMVCIRLFATSDIKNSSPIYSFGVSPQVFRGMTFLFNKFFLKNPFLFERTENPEDSDNTLTSN